MALISQPDVYMCDDFGAFEHDLGATDAYPTFSSIEPLDSGVDEQTRLENVAPGPNQPQWRSPPPLRLRRKPVSSIIWEERKQVILDLYIRQQLHLDEVQKRMKEQHDFDATEQMYKKRLREWGVRKYYTQPQKLDAIRQLREAPTETRDTLLLQLNGLPIKERRLWRPVMQNRNRVILAPRPSPDSRKNGRNGRQQLSRTPAPQRLQLKLGQETQTIEALLKYADRYHSWYLGQDRTKVQYGYTRGLGRVFGGLTDAFHLLRKGDSTGYCLINQSCSHFRAVLQTQPFQLMTLLIQVFATRRYIPQEYWEMRNLVLKFFASLARTSWEMSHPIPNIATLLLKMNQEHLASCLTSYAELLSDQTKTIHDATDSARIQLSIIALFEEAGQLDKASNLCWPLWEAVQRDSSVPPPVWTTVMNTWVNLSIQRRDYLAAEQFLMQRISESSVPTGKRIDDIYRIHEWRLLGWVYYCMKKPAESEKFLRLALEATLQNEGYFTKSVVHGILFEVEFVLEQFGKTEERAQLRIEHQHIWAELDEWRLDRDLPAGTN
ncbi:uncharacterized protein Z520_05174 [Fonsecaea multimorphosa CBS 102226]|uniref:Clr5 domain-containing protein n=1 Tax=Fonsecaea multimorphosa CBS 102226 TaxID=1442371 RepID=A0A0D2KPQ0_9EURO|nr:uncharacterized protein Z520_05174 [Fonsecaea multimorphosa CBS 102226]KIX98713.1 hypothetical protein Z520_05174 [Fonsecaea multimorphosa CBS 102226]OAL32946.1 hypothetical protein AYO22_00031 [Fonsecaea multimorphosa]